MNVQLNLHFILLIFRIIFRFKNLKWEFHFCFDALVELWVFGKTFNVFKFALLVADSEHVETEFVLFVLLLLKEKLLGDRCFGKFCSNFSLLEFFTSYFLSCFRIDLIIVFFLSFCPCLSSSTFNHLRLNLFFNQALFFLNLLLMNKILMILFLL